MGEVEPLSDPPSHVGELSEDVRPWRRSHVRDTILLVVHDDGSQDDGG